MKRTFLALTVAIGMGCATSAQADGFALGVKASTLGAGVEVTTNLVPMMLNGRIQLNGYNYSTTVNQTDVSYDAKLKLFSVGALADFYPFGGKFRLTGGVYYNGNKLDITGVPNAAASFVFNGRTYTAAQIGTVHGRMDFNKVAPYVGIGWGDAVSGGSPLGLGVDIGVLYQGKPKTSISTSKTVPGLAADIAAEKAKLDNSLNKFKFYPVAAISLSWRF